MRDDPAPAIPSVLDRWFTGTPYMGMVRKRYPVPDAERYSGSCETPQFFLAHRIEELTAEQSLGSQQSSEHHKNYLHPLAALLAEVCDTNAPVPSAVTDVTPKTGDGSDVTGDVHQQAGDRNDPHAQGSPVERARPPFEYPRKQSGLDLRRREPGVGTFQPLTRGVSAVTGSPVPISCSAPGSRLVSSTIESPKRGPAATMLCVVKDLPPPSEIE